MNPARDADPASRRPSLPLLREWPRRLVLSEYFVLALSIAYVLALYPFIPWLLGPRNVADVFSNMWPLLAIAIGQTFVLIAAGIDLSQTSVMALTSVIGAMVMTKGLDPILFTKSPLWGSLLHESGGILANSPLAVPVAVLAMTVVGSLVGFINGACVAVFKMPAFIVTLVSQLLFSAIAIFLPQSENIRNLPEAFLALGTGSVAGLPISMLITVTLAVLAHLLLNTTLFGRRLYATGNNPVASQVSGISTTRIIVLAYTISGFCAAIGSILYSARLELGRPTLGNGQLLDIVGACVIGGISLSGGKGKVTWTFFGVFFYVLLANSLNLLNLSFYTIDMVKGLVILVAALLDVTRSRAIATQR